MLVGLTEMEAVGTGGGGGGGGGGATFFLQAPDIMTMPKTTNKYEPPHVALHNCVLSISSTPAAGLAAAAPALHPAICLQGVLETGLSFVTSVAPDRGT